MRRCGGSSEFQPNGFEILVGGFCQRGLLPHPAKRLLPDRTGREISGLGSGLLRAARPRKFGPPVGPADEEAGLGRDLAAPPASGLKNLMR